MADLARAEGLLRELAEVLGIKLPAGTLRLVTPAQAALLDLGERHPFCELKIEFRAGQPYMATAEFAQIVERLLLS